MTHRLLLALLLLAATLAIEDDQTNITAPAHNPVIGIYTIDAQDFGQKKVLIQTYIASSYVKYVEMSAAQVVPLYYHYSHQQLEAVLPRLNGVFFTSGAMPIDWTYRYTSNIDYIIRWVNRQNDAGRPFPLWGTCLGYEAIMYIHSGMKDNMTVLTGVKDRLGLVDTVKVVDSTSSLIKSLTADEVKDMTTGDGLFWFDHYWVITVDTYKKYEGINSFWKLVTTSQTKEGVEFISTLEAHKYPYFLMQYHPEKNSFEQGIEARRDQNAIVVPLKWINTFIQAARLSPNRMDQQELKATSIHNFKLFQNPSHDFTAVYLFDEYNLQVYQKKTQDDFQWTWQYFGSLLLTIFHWVFLLVWIAITVGLTVIRGSFEQQQALDGFQYGFTLSNAIFLLYWPFFLLVYWATFTQLNVILLELLIGYFATYLLLIGYQMMILQNFKPYYQSQKQAVIVVIGYIILGVCYSIYTLTSFEQFCYLSLVHTTAYALSPLFVLAYKLKQQDQLKFGQKKHFIYLLNILFICYIVGSPSNFLHHPQHPYFVLFIVSLVILQAFLLFPSQIMPYLSSLFSRCSSWLCSRTRQFFSWLYAKCCCCCRRRPQIQEQMQLQMTNSAQRNSSPEHQACPQNDDNNSGAILGT